MSSRGWFAVIGMSFAMAFGASALLYTRSRSADFDGHARAVEAAGRVRHLDELLSEQVLAARFGLLNQYDSINATESALAAAEGDLAARIRDVVPIDANLTRALEELDASIATKRAAAEKFKTENSVLRNSTYYLPTAANDVSHRLSREITVLSDGRDSASTAIQRVTQTGLAYNLIGDETSREAHLRSLIELRSYEGAVPEELRRPLALLVAHAETIAREVPAVDGWVQRVVGADSGDKLAAVEDGYQVRFGGVVAISNRYRKILYAWSLLLLLSVGLAGLQLRRAYAGLERRVAERTVELGRAVAELWGEMKLARKIQEALVPLAPSIATCEVAARMMPTDDVGGDYYDVIRGANCEWILIGDVSGHGVPAGLVMMMCHTAVRTVLACRPDIGPDRLLALVNSVLTSNIRQLHEDKYMTISAFRRSPDGTVRFAGAHQDIHVFRAKSGVVETLPSTGIWLGLRDDIGDQLAVQEFRLEVGDQLMLHTDGITEAMRDGAMFDVDGLRRILQTGGNESAANVLADVFGELEAFEMTDDATIVIVKQLAPA